MDILTAVTQRRSIRKFAPEPVPEETIREILEEARWSPSWGNTQSWNLYVVTGSVLAAFKKESRRRFAEGTAPSPEIRPTEAWPESLKQRYNGIGKSVLAALSIERGNHQARAEYALDMFGLFDAPGLMVLCADRQIVLPYAALDIGLLLQTICLLAHSKGIGTCIMAVSVSYPDLLRSLLPIPDHQSIVIGTAFGYPDPGALVNQFARERAALGDLAVWMS